MFSLGKEGGREVGGGETILALLAASLWGPRST